MVIFHNRDSICFIFLGRTYQMLYTLLIAITKTHIQKIKIDIQKITVKEKASD
jgi:hypothetical protein